MADWAAAINLRVRAIVDVELSRTATETAFQAGITVLPEEARNRSDAVFADVTADVRAGFFAHMAAAAAIKDAAVAAFSSTLPGDATLDRVAFEGSNRTTGPTTPTDDASVLYLPLTCRAGLAAEQCTEPSSEAVANQALYTEAMEGAFVRNQAALVQVGVPKVASPSQFFVMANGVTRSYPSLASNILADMGEAGYMPHWESWSIAAATGPRDVVILIDTSGSMKGEKLKFAKIAAKRVILSLTQADRVGVVAFAGEATGIGGGDGAGSCNPDTLNRATKTAKQHMLDGVSGLAAEMRADINNAVEKGLGYFYSNSSWVDNNRMKLIYIFSDGADGEHDAHEALASMNVNRSIRVFAHRDGIIDAKSMIHDQGLQDMVCRNRGVMATIGYTQQVPLSIHASLYSYASADLEYQAGRYQDLLMTSSVIGHDRPAVVLSGPVHLNNTMRTARGLRSGDSDYIGTAGVSIDLTDMRAWVDAIAARHTDTGMQYFVINDEGVVLAHPRITRKDASRLDRDIKLSELGTGLSEDRINEIIEAGTDPEAVTSTSEVYFSQADVRYDGQPTSLQVTYIYARLLDALPFIGVLAVPESVTNINYASFFAGTTSSFLAGSNASVNAPAPSSVVQLTQRALCTTSVASETTADAIEGELATSSSTDCPDGSLRFASRRAADLTAAWSPNHALDDDIDAYYLTASDAGIVRVAARGGERPARWELGASDAELHRNLTQAAATMSGPFMVNLGEGVRTTGDESVQGIWIGAAMSISSIGLPAARPVLAARMNDSWDPLATCNNVSQMGDTVRCFIIDANADLLFDSVVGAATSARGFRDTLAFDMLVSTLGNLTELNATAVVSNPAQICKKEPEDMVAYNLRCAVQNNDPTFLDTPCFNKTDWPDLACRTNDTVVKLDPDTMPSGESCRLPQQNADCDDIAVYVQRLNATRNAFVVTVWGGLDMGDPNCRASPPIRTAAVSTGACVLPYTARLKSPGNQLRSTVPDAHSEQCAAAATLPTMLAWFTTIMACFYVVG
jgi:hypothetical protein